MAKAITFLALLLVFPAVYGANIYVGDDSGWNDYTDYEDWVRAKKTFTTKDLLVFSFSGRHSVAEVNETGFNYCDSSDPIYFNNTSPTSFPLTATGTRYFICPSFGHCAEGMKLAITVTDGSSTGTAPPSGTTPAPPSRTTPSTTASGTTPSHPASGTTPSAPPTPSSATVFLTGWNSLFVGVLVVVATLFGATG